MKLHNLKPALGSVHKKSKRVGRGQGSGKGGTSTRGHNGAKSRSGYSRKIGFEGGQMPLQRRVPKFGFKNINRKEYHILNVSDLQHIYETRSITEITPEVLVDLRITKKDEQVKILGNGELKVALNITAHKFSKSSIQIIEKNGGKVITLLKEKNVDKGTD